MQHKILKSLLRCQSGASAILLSLAAPPLIGATAIAVDFGMIYLEERDLQGIADAAANASVTTDEIVESGQARAQLLIDRSGLEGVTIDTFTPGTYEADVNVALGDRFQPTTIGSNAAEIRLTRRIPLTIGRFLGTDFSTVTATARAARTNMVAFNLGSDLFAFDKDLPGRYLSALALNNLGLSRVEVNAILDAQIDIGLFIDAIRARVGDPDDAYGEVFSGDASLSDVILAMSEAVDDAGVANSLVQIAGRVDGEDIELSSLIDLGPIGRGSVINGDDRMSVGAFMMLRAALQAGQGDSYSVDISSSIEGFGAVNLRIAGGEHTSQSPFLAIDPAKQIILHTAETRILVEVQTTGISIGDVRVPVFIELAPAEAQISNVVCDPSQSDNGVTLRVKPSIGAAKIGDVDYGEFTDFEQAPTVSYARLLETPVLNIDAYSDLYVGGDENC